MGEGERYNLEKAWEEAEQLRQKVESGATSSYEEAHEKTEQERRQELSPEMIEEIMEKVQDIDEPGTAYSGVAHTEWSGYMSHWANRWTSKLLNFKKILQEGLLGWPSAGGPSKKDKKRWREFIRRERDKLIVHFNIVGRTSDKIPQGKTQISQTSYVSGMDNLGLIFDISSFRETDIPHPQYNPLKSGGYRTYHSSYMGEPGLDAGFLLSYRVAPRLFRGIIFAPPSRVEKFEGKENAVEDRRPESMAARAEEIKSTILEAYKEKPELLIPIYDVDGSLWWPERMSYEEVRRLVAEREGKKE